MGLRMPFYFLTLNQELLSMPADPVVYARVLGRKVIRI